MTRMEIYRDIMLRDGKGVMEAIGKGELCAVFLHAAKDATSSVEIADILDRIEKLERWKAPCTPSFLTKMRQDMEEMKGRIDGLERKVDKLKESVARMRPNCPSELVKEDASGLLAELKY